MAATGIRFGKHLAPMVTLLGVLVQVLPFLLVPEVQAIPAWARKYDVQCATCHTRPPRLNKFGEAFHEMTFQMPMTREQETRSKKKVRPVFLEKDLANNFAVRAAGNFAEFTTVTDREDDVNLAFPNELTLFLTSSLTDHITLFSELDLETRELECTSAACEIKQEFGLGQTPGPDARPSATLLSASEHRLLSALPGQPGRRGGSRAVFLAPCGVLRRRPRLLTLVLGRSRYAMGI